MKTFRFLFGLYLSFGAGVIWCAGLRTNTNADFLAASAAALCLVVLAAIMTPTKSDYL